MNKDSIKVKFLGREFTVDWHLNQWLACDFHNGQWGLNIDAKFFKHKSSAIRYGKRKIKGLK